MEYSGSGSTRSRIGEKALALSGQAILSYFEPLPETRSEVETIAGSFYGAVTLMLGADASESTLKQLDLTPYSHIHLATHGVIGHELPGFFEPALVLAAESGENGLLTTTEVAQLALDAELAVLSACNTGNGEYFDGEGLVGMGRAFMVAGARNVIVSLWPVDSFATKSLMEFLYERLSQGLNVSRALFEAQQALRDMSGTKTESVGRETMLVGPGLSGVGPVADSKFRRYEDPFFWSSFVLVSSG